MKLHYRPSVVVNSPNYFVKLYRCAPTSIHNPLLSSLHCLTTVPVLSKQVEEDMLLWMLLDDGLVEFYP